MTPRSIGSYNPNRDFARQVAEQTSEPPTKKRRSYAPKGSKLASGYTDRATLRDTVEDEDDKAKRLKSLEEMLKLQQIDQATFEKLRNEIGVGGDVASTHLVKGLDWRLLERVKRGEDVTKDKADDDNVEVEVEEKVDVEDELDGVLQKEVVAGARPVKEHVDKVEEAASASLSRDEILRQLKERRQQQSMPPPAPEPVLGDRFKKVESTTKSNKKKFVETVNGRRREVLVFTDREGKVKRKTRWLDPENAVKTASSDEQKAQPMGMEVPAEFVARQKALLEQQKAEDDDDDIFQGVGAEYDPLAGIDSASEEEDVEKENSDKSKDQQSTQGMRNYFGATEPEPEEREPVTRDPTILAALKRAAALRQGEDSKGSAGRNGDAEPTDRGRAMLEKSKRSERDDALDLDMGFGESRFGDEDDEDGPVFDEEGDKKKEKVARKRGPKKRKGDKDSVNDVMSVLEGRKKKDS